MTFLNLQDRVMGRLNLSSTEARSRIKNFLNERYRRLQTSINLGKVRRSTMTFPTVNGTYTYSPTNVIKVFTMAYPAGNRVLAEQTLDQLRVIDPDNSQTGPPRAYAVTQYTAIGLQVYIWPKPDAAYTIQLDGLLKGTDLSLDADVPAFPEDFHDILEFGATADELEKMEKPDQAAGFEDRAERRSRDLRYFMSKSAYLYSQQTDMDLATFWWTGPYGGYWGWGGY